jgi:carbonic anhydrase
MAQRVNVGGAMRFKDHLKSVSVFQGNARFRREVFEPHRAAFEQLVHGQSPRALYVGCSDSRVVAEMLLDVAPGELFVVRNIGAIVPHPEDPASTSLGAALDYALHVLKVPEIIVCGHDLCGALRAIVDGGVTHGSHLERWLRKGSALSMRASSRVMFFWWASRCRRRSRGAWRRARAARPVLAHVAVAAEHLNRAVGDVLRHGRAVELHPVGVEAAAGLPASASCDAAWYT